MNPNYVDPYYDQGGDANGLVSIIAWFVLVSLVFWITGVLKLSYKSSLWAWGICNAAPLVWFLSLKPDFLPFLGLCAVTLFSWSIGRSVFDARERDRRLREKLLAEDREDNNRR